jgi:hypothetical protein
MSAFEYLFDVEDVLRDVISGDVFGGEVVVRLKDKAHLPHVVNNAFGRVITYKHDLLQFLQASSRFRIECRWSRLCFFS